MNRTGPLAWRWIAPAFLLIATAASLVASGSVAQEQSVTFAALGDFGADNSSHTAVADMMERWDPEFIITMGDNRYGVADYDPVIGRRYCHYLKDVTPGGNCAGGTSQTNRFFPAVGNHDYSDGNGIDDYLDYFTLPGNELHYDYVRGPVHLFVVDSGNWGSVDQEQADWLRDGLQASTSPWQVVYLHHSPYSSAEHGSNANMQLDYAAWGADAVLSGHDHHYERIEQDGIVYFVNGLGGRSIYGISDPVPGSLVRYNQNYGAMKVTATSSELNFEFRAVDGGSGQLIDSYTIGGSGHPTTTVSPTTVPPNGGTGAIEVRVGARGDDVEQVLSDSSLYTDSSDLELVDDTSYRGSQVVGLRFRGLNIPVGATVTNASVRFVADESDAQRTDLVIAGHDVGQTWAFSGLDAVTSRASTSATAPWSNVPAWTQGGTYETPNVAAVIQEIVVRADWRPGNDLALLVSGVGERTAESFDGSPAQAPLLRIEYSTEPPPTTQPPTTDPPPTTSPGSNRTVDVRISAGIDDVEEQVANGSVYGDSSDLELTDDSSYKGSQVVGLRFRSIGVPAGATITSATIQFTADESDATVTDLIFRGHDTADAWPFTADAGGVSARSMTSASVRWTGVEPWQQGERYTSPSLQSVIQEIIDRDDWRSGNALAVLISGTGERTAESYDGQPNAAPLLHISFTVEAQPPPTVPTTTTTTTGPTTTTTTTTTGPTTTTSPPISSLDVRVAIGADDVEEDAVTGALYVDSSDIELVEDRGYKGPQLVGLRFTNIGIPAGSTITSAKLQFTADESDAEGTELTVAGHDTGSAWPFTGSGAVSNRQRTTASVVWNPVAPWVQGRTYESPNLRTIIQEIVERGDWRSGNDVTLVITGAGQRTAESFEGRPGAAALLRIEYTTS